MMAELINLRQRRKAIARDEKTQTAEANRQKFGRTKDERAQTEAEKTRAEKSLDGHKQD